MLEQCSEDALPEARLPLSDPSQCGDAGVPQAGAGKADADPGGNQPAARLRVPSTRKALSWWSQTFWPEARPTEFCYGDTVWGMLDRQPKPLEPTDWMNMLWRREELEYDVD